MRLLLLLLWSMSCAGPLIAGDVWPRFRGPNGSGWDREARLPVSWQAGDARFDVELPGIGNASPVVWHDRLFVTSANEDSGQQHLQCLDPATGNELWKHSENFETYRKHKNNSYASSTPAVDADHVYWLRQFPDRSPVMAFDHRGQLVWERDLGPYRHGQGAASSPIVVNDLLIISNDHGEGSGLFALSRRTGEIRWQIPREGKRACYSTPCLWQAPDGTRQLVFTHSFEGIQGFDPDSGRRLWKLDVFGRESQRAVSSPIQAGRLLLAGSGARGGTRRIVAVAPSATSAEEVYTIERGSPHVPTVIAGGDRVFMWSDSGIVTCLDQSTGDVQWQRRVGGSYFASPVGAGDRLYCPDLDGTLVVIRALGDFEVLARNPLPEGSMATPAIAHHTLFVRTRSRLLAFSDSPSGR